MTDWIREPAVAGRFYTADPDALKADLDRLCPKSTSTDRPWGVMAPHAGYLYSGKVAGAVYSRCDVPDEVVVLCPNHTGRGSKVSVWAEGVWRTPIGDVPVASARARRFLEALPDAKADRDAHAREHAIEVHVPFLRHRNPNVSIVPIVLGGLRWEECKRVAEAITRVSEGALVVASTDMSHFIPAETARRLDELALREVDALNGNGLYDTVVRNDISMCGFIPTSCVIEAARLSGVKRSERSGYAHSGEVTGDASDVVAYAGAWFLKAPALT